MQLAVKEAPLVMRSSHLLYTHSVTSLKLRAPHKFLHQEYLRCVVSWNHIPVFSFSVSRQNDRLYSGLIQGLCVLDCWLNICLWGFCFTSPDFKICDMLYVGIIKAWVVHVITPAERRCFYSALLNPVNTCKYCGKENKANKATNEATNLNICN